MMVILHIAPLNFKKITGLVPSVLSYVTYQNRQIGVRAALLTIIPQTIDKKMEFPLYAIGSNGITEDIESLPSPFNKPDIVIFHSTYIIKQIIIAHKLKKQKIPYIIVPHGGMTSAAQKKARIKKIVGNVLFFNRYVSNSIGIHYLTEKEAVQSSKWNKNFFVVPNGIEIPTVVKQYKSIPNNRLRFLFIGRIDPYHKGLDLFIKASSMIREQLIKNNVIVDIYGPDFNGGKSQLLRMIRNYKLEDIIFLHDPVFEREKEKAFLQSDVFFHTSRFEGHPIAVLEALSYGIPCLVTPGTNIDTEIRDANAGWIANGNVYSISEIILQIISQKNLIPQLGEKARKLAKKYDWNIIAQDSIENYKKLMNYV